MRRIWKVARECLHWSSSSEARPPRAQPSSPPELNLTRDHFFASTKRWMCLTSPSNKRLRCVDAAQLKLWSADRGLHVSSKDFQILLSLSRDPTGLCFGLYQLCCHDRPCEALPPLASSHASSPATASTSGDDHDHVETTHHRLIAREIQRRS